MVGPMDSVEMFVLLNLINGRFSNILFFQLKESLNVLSYILRY
jgi:hypothetical protein